MTRYAAFLRGVNLGKRTVKSAELRAAFEELGFSDVKTLLASGLGMVGLAGGFGRVHWSVHAMMAIGLVMMAVFLHLRFAPYPRLRRAVAAREWPAAATQLGTVRRLVEVNLALGVVVFALAVVGRVF